jgi:Flp pilus assembly pilin Flp
MFDIVRVLATMWRQRWDALREDDGASTIEYVLLVLLGIAVAGIAAVAIRAVVTQKSATIRNTPNP